MFIYEYIVFSIIGMICIGCEIKFYCIFGIFFSIKNLKISLVFFWVEFDFEKRFLVDVMRYVERIIEFKCERVKKGVLVDVIVLGGVLVFMGEWWLKGVIDMVLVNDIIVNIFYDL